MCIFNKEMTEKYNKTNKELCYFFMQYYIFCCVCL